MNLGLAGLAVTCMFAAPTNADEVAQRVVITGTRSEQPQQRAPIQTDVHDRETIEQIGAQNAAEVLEEVPGIQLQRSVGGTGVSLAGLPPTYTLILINGHRLPGRVNGTIDLTRIPTDDIERIEVVSGAGAVLYGSDAIGGTVNIITRQTEKTWESELHGTYGSFQTADLSARVGHARDKLSTGVSAGLHRTDGWDADPSDLTTTGPARRQHEASASVDFEGQIFRLHTWGQYTRQQLHNIDALQTGAVFDRYNRTETTTVTAAPELNWGDGRLRLLSSYSLFRDQFYNNQRNSIELDTSQQTFDHIGEVTAQIEQSLDKHNITAGLTGQVEVLQADRIQPAIVERQRVSAFLQDQWTPRPSIQVFPGIRVDADSQFGFYATPRLAVMIEPTTRWRIRTSLGRGFRAPSFRELYLQFANSGAGYRVRGNATLRPETSWNTIFRADYLPWRWITVSAGLSHVRVSDMITIDQVSALGETATVFSYRNIAEAETRSLDTRVTAARGPLSLATSYTYTAARDLVSQLRLPGVARHRATASLNFTRASSGSTASVRSAFVGRRAFSTSSEQSSLVGPRYVSLDARLAQAVYQHAELSVGADNILNAGNASNTPIQPRTYYFGATIRL